MNIYGAQDKADEKVAKIMNEVSQLGGSTFINIIQYFFCSGSEWKGRLYLSITMEKPVGRKPPLAGNQSISDAKFLMQANDIKMYTYELRTDILYAINLPNNDKYCIKIKWGQAEIATSKKVFFGNFNEILYRF